MKEEILELTEDIEAAKNYIELLESQKEKLDVHKLELVESSQKLEEQKRTVEKETMKLKDEVLPMCVTKILNAVNQTVNCIEDLESALQEPVKNNLNFPIKTVFQVDVKPYLDLEASVLEHMNSYLNENFKKCIMKLNNSIRNDITEKIGDHLSKSSQTKTAQEALHLRNVRQAQEEKYLQLIFNESRLENEITFLKNLIEKNDYSSYNIPIALLQHKLDQSERKLKEAENKEAQIQSDIPKTIRDHLEIQYKWVASLHSIEKLKRFKFYLELLEKPLDILYEQRARLEFLNIVMKISENNLSNLKNCINSFMHCVEEINNNHVDPNYYIEKMKDTPMDINCVSDNTLLCTLNNLLDLSKCGTNHEIAYLTISNVIENANKLKLMEETLINSSKSVLQKQFQLLNEVNSNIFLFEKCLQGDEEHPFFMVDKFLMSIGILSSRIHSFQEDFLKEMNNYKRKKGMISKNNNIALARKLFVYALTNPVKFEKAIKEVKYRVEVYERKKKEGKKITVLATIVE